MRKKIVLIGLALLIAGIAIIGVSLYEMSALSTINSSLTQVSSNEWRSDLINVNSSGVLTVTTNATSGFGLIPASDLSVVTASNLASYAVGYDTSTTSGSLNAFVYDQINGQYYFVIFSSSEPTMTYLFLTAEGEIFGELLIVGAGIAFVGLVMAIVGAILKKKVQPIEEFN